MKCKYDESHGDFKSPVMLGRHYQNEHTEVHTPKVQAKSPSIWRCNYCPREYSWPADVRKHILRAHFEKVQGAYISEEHSTKRSRNPSKELVAVKKERKPKPVPVELHVDDIVVNVVAAMASPNETIEIRKLPAILAWRDATAAMLEATK